MLSVTCKAAIKAAVYLGSRVDAAEKSSIKQVAQHIDENEHTVGKLLQKLAKDGIINSSKGPTGGFFLSDKQLNQRIITIVETIDGKEVFKQCGLGLSQCSEKRPCPFHNDFKIVRDLFKKMCEEQKIADMQGNLAAGFSYLTS
jgi:Rrf2 family protein